METYELLEREWGVYSQAPNVVACSSGTAALHLALETLRARHGWPDGAQVLVPDLTMVACPRAVVLAGLTPVFVGCRPDDLLMDVSLLGSMSIGAAAYPDSGFHDCTKVVAVMPVHVYGRRCDMDVVTTFARSHGIAVVEDCAEFHGGPIHLLSDAWCWSFYRNKVVAGEEGGAVAFRDPEAAHTARSLRSLGFTEAHDFTHRPRGHNYRMSNVHAHLIRESLAHAEGELVRRQELEGLMDSLCPPEWRMPVRFVPWVYDLRIPNLGGRRQDELVATLNRAGVAARHCFKPMHELEEFKDCRLVAGQDASTRGGLHHTRASKLAREVVYLPLSVEMTEARCEQAFWIVRSFF